MRFDHSLTEAQKRRWSDYWQKCRHGYPRQHHLFGEVERAKGRVPIYVSGECNANLVLVGVFSIRPLVFGHRGSFEAVCLRGPAFDEVACAASAFRQIIDYFSRLWVGSIQAGPYWIYPEAETVERMLVDLGFSPYGHYIRGTRRHTGLVSLERSDEEFLSAFSESARREVRRAQRQDIVARYATSREDAETFFNELNRMNRERGLPKIGFAEYQAMFDRILREGSIGVIINGFKGDSYLGGLLLVRSGWTAHTSKFVVVNQELKKLANLRLAPLLFWHGMRWARDQGCKTLDLEGYLGEQDSSGHLHLIHEYKRAFRPTAVEVLGQYSLVCSPLLARTHRLSNILRSGVSSLGQVRFRLDVWRKTRRVVKIQREQSDARENP